MGLESTVIALLDGPPRLLRLGGVTRARIEALIGPIGRGIAPSAGEAPRGLRSPVELTVPGGVLTVAWEAPNRAVMSGDAVKEYETAV